MNTLTLKLILTPLLIGGVSLAGRRWGPAISGWLVGLPLTSGPISFFLALNQGVTFASAAAVGTLAGLLSPFPLYAATLSVFAHHQQGPTQAANVLSGLLLRLFAFAGFFLVLGALLEQTGILLAFAAAMITAFVFQAGSLWLLRRKPG